jgi:hypothetical protein
MNTPATDFNAKLNVAEMMLETQYAHHKDAIKNLLSDLKDKLDLELRRFTDTGVVCGVSSIATLTTDLVGRVAAADTLSNSLRTIAAARK